MAAVATLSRYCLFVVSWAVPHRNVDSETLRGSSENFWLLMEPETSPELATAGGDGSPARHLHTHSKSGLVLIWCLKRQKTKHVPSLVFFDVQMLQANNFMFLKRKKKVNLLKYYYCIFINIHLMLQRDLQITFHQMSISQAFKR